MTQQVLPQDRTATGAGMLEARPPIKSSDSVTVPDSAAALLARAAEIDREIEAAIEAATEPDDWAKVSGKIAELKKQRRAINHEMDVAVDVERVLARKAAEQQRKQREEQSRTAILQIDREDGPALETMATKYWDLIRQAAELETEINDHVLSRRRKLMDAAEIFPGARESSGYRFLFDHPPDVRTRLAALRVFYGLATEPRLSRYNPTEFVGTIRAIFDKMTDAAKRVLP